MGRTVIVEEQVEGDLGRLFGAQAVQIGLLVGQVTSQKDYVVFAVRTPSVKEISQEEGPPTADTKAKPSNSPFFEDWWVVEHARQVSAMLPGGLSIIGLFLASPPDVVKSLHPRLRKLLNGVSSQHNLTSFSLAPPPHMARVLLHSCTKTKKYPAHLFLAYLQHTVDGRAKSIIHDHLATFLGRSHLHFEITCGMPGDKTIEMLLQDCYPLTGLYADINVKLLISRTHKHSEIVSIQAGFRPAELKFQPHCSKWHKVECPVHLHVDTYIPNIQNHKKLGGLQSDIMAGLHPSLESFATAVVTVRGKSCLPEDPLVKPPSQRKGQPSLASSGESIAAAMYLRKPPTPSLTSPSHPLHTPGHLKLMGSMKCFAYVHSRATCGEAISAIKHDAISSLLNRLSYLWEEVQAERMEVATAENKPEIIRAGGMESELAKSHSSVFTSRQLPRRVSVTLPSSELTLCEYCFPDESEEDCRGRVAELFGVSAEDIAVKHLEEFPVVVGESSVDGPVPDDTHAQTGSALPLISLVAALAVALVAVAVWVLQNS